MNAQRLEGKIHIYHLDLVECQHEPYRHRLALLDAGEQERASRIRHEQTRRCFVWVRSCLRGLLGHYLGTEANGIRFVLNEKGKPRLAGTAPNQGLVFNVSHSGDCGLIALARDTALGVDVERHRPMPHMEGMAERCFADAELAWWRSLPEGRRQQAFFTFWSCKEAFVKATGEGIALGLDACVVDLSGQPRLLSIPPSQGTVDEWRLAEIDVGGGYSAALCHNGAERTVLVANALAFAVDP